MSIKQTVIDAVQAHLVSCGFSGVVSQVKAEQAYRYYEKSICNSKDVFRDICDHAGMLASQMDQTAKYKSPKAKSKPRSKRPQEAFRF